MIAARRARLLQQLRELIPLLGPEHDAAWCVGITEHVNVRTLRFKPRVKIMIERARWYAAGKHGGGRDRVTLSEDVASTLESVEELLAIDQALTRLERQDAQMASVVKLRYFAGLEVEETAQALRTSTRTVNRLWTAARAWLARELAAAEAGG